MLEKEQTEVAPDPNLHAVLDPNILDEEEDEEVLVSLSSTKIDAVMNELVIF